MAKDGKAVPMVSTISSDPHEHVKKVDELIDLAEEDGDEEPLEIDAAVEKLHPDLNVDGNEAVTVPVDQLKIDETEEES